MACKPFRLPDGISGFVCTRGVRAPRCATPGCNGRGAFQCDYPLTSTTRGTCDRWMCARCRVAQAPDVDYCRVHAEMSAKAPPMPARAKAEG